MAPLLPYLTAVAVKNKGNSLMSIPISIQIKNFLGLYVLTPLELDLLNQLKLALNAEDKETLTYQLGQFSSIRRLLKHIPEPNSHGFTNFYVARHAKTTANEFKGKLFMPVKEEQLLGITKVTFEGGEIEVQFWAVRGVLFSMEYRSPQNIYYPKGSYYIHPVTLVEHVI